MVVGGWVQKIRKTKPRKSRDSQNELKNILTHFLTDDDLLVDLLNGGAEESNVLMC